MNLKVGQRWRIAVWLSLACFIALYLARNLHLVSDMRQFMPVAHSDAQLQTLIDELQNGPAIATLMLRIDGGNTDELATLSKSLRQELNTQSNLFQSVYNGEVNQAWQDLDRLFEYRYLVSSEVDWSAEGLRKTFEQRIKDLQIGGGALLSDYMVTDPQLLFLRYLHSAVETNGPAIHQGVWFDAENKSALLLVRVRTQSLDLEIMQKAITFIETTFLSLRHNSQFQLQIAGPGMMAVATRASIERVTHRLTLVMIILIVTVFLVAYRSLRLLWLLGIPLLSAVCFGLALTQWIFGEVHAIVIVLGITLLGVCIDYPIYLFSHLQRAEAPLVSLQRVWPILRFGGMILAVAFLALLGSGFTGLSQLAVFTASGVVIALLITRYLLAYLVTSESTQARLWHVPVRMKAWQRRSIVAVLMTVPLLVIALAPEFWEKSIEAISPVPTQARDADKNLRHALNAPEVSHVFVMSGDDQEKVLQVTELLDKELNQAKSAGIISAWWSATQLLPSHQTQQMRRQQLPTAVVLSASIKQALTGLPFRADAFHDWVNTVLDSRAIHDLTLETILSTPLAEAMHVRLFQHDLQWVSMVRIGGIRSDAELLQWLNSHPVAKSSHVQIKTASQRLLEAYRYATTERLTFVIIILSVAILLWTKNLLSAGRIILPVVIGNLTGLAVPLLLGTHINVFHLMSILLVTGIGLNYSLFFQQQRGSQEYAMCLHAISISALTNTVAFGVIAIANVPVLSAIGQTVSSGILVCFISAWLLQGAAHDMTPSEHT